MADRLHIVFIGAHPDDCEYHAGGTVARWTAAGHRATLVSATDGSAGHHVMSGTELAKRRAAEFASASAVVGAASVVLPIPDGGLMPTMDHRLTFIRLIRRLNPDLIITHRPNDYHPDHRYTSLLVQDSAFMVMVPAVAADVPAMTRNPVIVYTHDHFKRPYPFQPSVAIDITATIQQKMDALDRHESQFYEWLPFVKQHADRVPADRSKRRAWLFDFLSVRNRIVADQCRELLVARYGERGRTIEFAEAFEAGEYGTPLDEAQTARLFAGL